MPDWVTPDAAIGPSPSPLPSHAHLLEDKSTSSEPEENTTPLSPDPIAGEKFEREEQHRISAAPNLSVLQEGQPSSPQPPPPNVRRLGPPSSPLKLKEPTQSIRFSDITPRQPMNEETCRKKLTSYEAYTICKLIPRDPKEKTTWARSKVTKEPLSQDDIQRSVKRHNESRRTVQDKKATLMPFQQGQVNRVLDELNSAEYDTNFKWSMAQIDSKVITNRKGQKETSTITVFVKRAPLYDLDPVALFQALERRNMEKIAAINAPPSIELPQRAEISQVAQQESEKVAGLPLERRSQEQPHS